MKLEVRKVENYTKEYYKAGEGWVTYTYAEPIYLLEEASK